MAPSIRSLLIGLLPFAAAQCPYASVDKRDLLVGRGDEPSLTTLDNSFGKCHTLSDMAGSGTRSRDWFPCQLKLDVLRQYSVEQNPLGGTFDYAEAFSKLDCKSKVVSESCDAMDLTQCRLRTKGRYQGLVNPIATLVAGRLWNLWRSVYSDGLAQRRYLSGCRWPWGWWHGKDVGSRLWKYQG